MKATVEIKKMPPRTMLHFHHELAKAEIDGHKVRFCQHINFGCFWLCVDDETYQVVTQDLINSVVDVVMKCRKRSDQKRAKPSTSRATKKGAGAT